jgi:YfiH family protein
MDQIDIFRAQTLDGVPHGFLGRRGGVSTGIHAGLNVGVGSEDDQDAVLENRRRAAEAVLPGAGLATVFQIHSADVAVIDAVVPLAARPQADAMVTNRSGLLLGILTADCAPVLLADKAAGVVGAAHAVWKGALGGVTDQTIAAMEALGADRGRITAAVGPCIARSSYEVDAGFAQRFEAHDPANERFFTPGRTGHFQFDLEGYVVNRLAQAGIGTVAALGQDTYSDADRFYSFRRATPRGEPG